MKHVWISNAEIAAKLEAEYVHPGDERPFIDVSSASTNRRGPMNLMRRELREAGMKPADIEGVLSTAKKHGSMVVIAYAKIPDWPRRKAN